MSGVYICIAFIVENGVRVENPPAFYFLIFLVRMSAAILFYLERYGNKRDAYVLYCFARCKCWYVVVLRKEYGRAAS